MVVKKDGGYVVLPIKFQPFLRFNRLVGTEAYIICLEEVLQPFLRFNT